MENGFKFVFFLAVLTFCFAVVGIFLVIIKILLIFYPQINFMGVVFSGG